MSNQQMFEQPRVLAVGEPHLACVLLLDTSGSMAGAPIENLNKAVNMFKEQTSLDEMAKKRVDVAVIEFNDHARVIQDFSPITELGAVELTAGGCTAMGEAINLAIDKVKERNHFYQSFGTPCFKPWIFMITDGAPTDSIELAISRIQNEEQKGSHGKLKFFVVGVPGYDKNRMLSLTKRIIELENADFKGIFNWLSESMVTISVSKIGDNVQLPKLPNNATIPPESWGS